MLLDQVRVRRLVDGEVDVFVGFGIFVLCLFVLESVFGRIGEDLALDLVQACIVTEVSDFIEISVRLEQSVAPSTLYFVSRISLLVWKYG